MRTLDVWKRVEIEFLWRITHFFFEDFHYKMIDNCSNVLKCIFIGIFLSLIALITTIGNLFVIVAFYYDQKLRTINGKSLLDLINCSFWICVKIILYWTWPLQISLLDVFVFHSTFHSGDNSFLCIFRCSINKFSIANIWPFGKIFCQIWVKYLLLKKELKEKNVKVTMDDVSTMASVINIVAITINRYWLIAHPISYRKYIKQRFVYSAMAFIWIVSFRKIDIFFKERKMFCYWSEFWSGYLVDEFIWKSWIWFSKLFWWLQSFVCLYVNRPIELFCNSIYFIMFI